MEDVLSMHELNCSQHLKHVILDFVERQRLALVFEAFVEVLLHELKD